MNVSLTPKLEALVQQKLASGLYNSASEVIREALRLLEERDQLRSIRLGNLRNDVAVGLDQLQRGQVSEFDEKSLAALADGVKTRGRKRLPGKKKPGA